MKEEGKWEEKNERVEGDALPQETRFKKAVALKYEAQKDAAPRVVAKGQGWIAERILQQAEGGEVPVMKDESLVELLYPLALDQRIPEELYPVVAEVFSFIYRLEKKQQGGM